MCDHRRARPRAGEIRRAGLRHQCRHPRRARRGRGLRAPPEDRRGPARRHLAVRSRHPADVLAGGDLFRHRRSRRARAARRTSVGALPGIPRRRRLAHHRRREPGELGANGAACSALANGWRTRASAATRERMKQPRRADRGHERAPQERARWTSCIQALEAEGVPCGPINSIAEMAADPQALAREMVVELEHPRAGRTRALGLPVKLSRTPGKVSRPAPLLGQHTREVLAEFGFSRAEIDALVAERSRSGCLISSAAQRSGGGVMKRSASWIAGAGIGARPVLRRRRSTGRPEADDFPQSVPCGRRHRHLRAPDRGQALAAARRAGADREPGRRRRHGRRGQRGEARARTATTGSSARCTTPSPRACTPGCPTAWRRISSRSPSPRSCRTSWWCIPSTRTRSRR